MVVDRVISVLNSANDSLVDFNETSDNQGALTVTTASTRFFFLQFYHNDKLTYFREIFSKYLQNLCRKNFLNLRLTNLIMNVSFILWDSIAF